MASSKPSPVRTAAFTTLAEKRLYIVGGFQVPLTRGTPTTPGINQFVSLDLTVPTWSASSPPWTIHSPLPFNLGPYPLFAVLPKSQDRLIVGTGDDAQGVATFNLGSNEWSTGAPYFTAYTSSSGVLPVVDPDTDTIIVPTGTSVINETEVYLTFLHTINSNQFTTAPGPETVGNNVPATLREYAIAWSSVRKSVLVYGGRAELASNQWQYSSSLLEFSPTAKTWKELTASGPSPGGINWGCLVPAYNGQKMVLFGGFSRDVLTPSIYILDVEKLEWTKGQDIDASLMRFEHVCTVAGDSFVAWGGLNSANSSTAFQDPVIYDLKAGRWTQQFALVSPSTPTTPTDGSKSPSGTPPNPPGDGGSSNTGAIVGGVAGILFCLLIIGVFFIKRRRHRQSQERSSSPIENIEGNKAEQISDTNTIPLQPPPSEPWSNNNPPWQQSGQTIMATDTSAMASGAPSPSTTLVATPVTYPAASPRTSWEPRSPHGQPDQQQTQQQTQSQPSPNPQEYAGDSPPQVYFPPPPGPQQQPCRSSTHDSFLSSFDILPSSSTSLPASSDFYQAHHDEIQEYLMQSPRIRDPQQWEGTELERRIQMEQQEIEHLELEHLIQRKKIQLERLLEEQRVRSSRTQSFHEQSRS